MFVFISQNCPDFFPSFSQCFPSSCSLPPHPCLVFILLPHFFSFCIYSGKGEGSKSRATRAGTHTGWIFVLLSHRVNKCPCSNTFSHFTSQGLFRARIPLHSHRPGLSSLSFAVCGGLAQDFPLLLRISKNPKPTQSLPVGQLELPRC